MVKALLVLLAISVVSCATAGKPPRRDALIGKWRSANGAQVGEYRFLPNGTFTGSVTSGGGLLAKFTGRWALREGAIAYEYLTDATGNIPPGTKDQDKLVAISADRYTIQAADGSRRNYVRVRE